MSTSIRRALLSVSAKDGLAEFAGALAQLGIEIVSTGGTASLLESRGVPVHHVADVTGFPEIMDGRVKTLHPHIHGAILARRDTDDAVLREHGIEPIDLVVVNLYPFAATIARANSTIENAIENIDVGGPAMIRAAAKNHERVTVVVDPQDYATVLQELTQGGTIAAATRRRLAAKAFAHTAAYDATVAQYLSGRIPTGGEAFPELLSIEFRKRLELRYGENPHQRAAFYVASDAAGASIGTAVQLQGRELSFNNLADGDTAFECVRQFTEPACVIVKHANPCGAALGRDALEAYDRAYRTDPTSAFGGIIALNRKLDAETATTILERQFVEVLIVPDIEPAAREVCARKGNVRVLTTGGLEPSSSRYELRSVNGGLLMQTRDEGRIEPGDLKVVTSRAPTLAELDDLLFAWRICKFVKSNAIVLAGDRMTIGVGAGQMSRVVASRIAAMKARDEGLPVEGAALASDAFFPFRDGLDAAAGLGVRSVIQPGGSKRDDEVIAAANEHDIAMVFTGMRHFRH